MMTSYTLLLSSQSKCDVIYLCAYLSKVCAILTYIAMVVIYHPGTWQCLTGVASVGLVRDK